MSSSRRELIGAGIAASMAAAASGQTAKGKVEKFVRYRKGGTTGFGILEGDTIHPISGGLFGARARSGAAFKLSEAKLLHPIEQPSKIVALAGNYQSHLGTRPPAPHPEPFYKPTSCLQNPDDPIVIPKGATDVHFECELVIVIGKTASRVSVAQAKDYIFGVTCGNDVSERIWQNSDKKDIQWWRAKGADTFGPVGPSIARGLDYHNLKISTRLNGQVMQEDSTSHFVHDCHITVSFISQYVTLLPGDLIFTGTPGKTSPMKARDVVEIDIEGIGVLRNKVVAG